MRQKHAVISVSFALRPDFTVQQFHKVPATCAVERLEAARSRFAQRHGVPFDAVSAAIAPEKLTYRFRYAANTHSQTPDDYNKERAIEYAKWLAVRDGIIIPAGLKVRADWSGFESATKTRKQTRSWSGTTEHAVYCKRIRAIEWGTETKIEHFNTLKNGRRGAWLYNETKFEAEIRIEIPHWDWEPREPVEETDHERESVFA